MELEYQNTQTYIKVYTNFSKRETNVMWQSNKQ